MENQKIYQLLGIFTLIFILLLSIISSNIRDQILDKIDQNRHLIAKNLEHQINVWIDEQINIIEKTKIIFESKKIYNNEDEISKFSKDFLYLKTNFDIIQFFIDEKFTMLNGKKILDFKNNLTDENLKRIENAKKLEWFIKTKKSNQTTINYIKTCRTQSSNRKFLYSNKRQR